MAMISVAPALCVGAVGVANVTRNSRCSFMILGSRRGAVLRTGRGVAVWSQGECVRWGGVGVGRNGLLGREKFSVGASRSDEEKDVRFSQQVRQRSDSEGEEDGLRKGSGVPDEEEVSVSAFHEAGDSVAPDVVSPRRFRNRFLGLVKLRSNIAKAAEGVFKSEIRRRIFVTIVLLMASRAGYFIPLLGFDRRYMPGDYLGFVFGAVEELGDAVSELKLSMFQLGISPYILSSIVMQVSCHLIPALVWVNR